MAKIVETKETGTEVSCTHCGKIVSYEPADVRFLDIEKDGQKTAKNTIMCPCPLTKIITV